MKVTLTKWAAARYDPVPSLWTLRRWAREGEFHPAPELVGNTYYVDEKARRMSVPEPKATLVERMQASA